MAAPHNSSNNSFPSPSRARRRPLRDPVSRPWTRHRFWFHSRWTSCSKDEGLEGLTDREEKPKTKVLAMGWQDGLRKTSTLLNYIRRRTADVISPLQHPLHLYRRCKFSYFKQLLDIDKFRHLANSYFPFWGVGSTATSDGSTPRLHTRDP